MGLTFNTKLKVEKIDKNLKTRNRVYVIATLFTILMLLPYIPFWFNITGAMETFGIGQFHTEKDYIKIYGNKTAGVHIQLDIQLRRYSDTDIVSGEKVYQSGYNVLTSISMLTSEDVDPLGFTFSVQVHLKDDLVMESDMDFFDPPREILQFNTGYIMDKDVVCNSTGIISYQFLMDLIVYNETIDYYIDYLIPYGNLEYNNYNIIFYAFLSFYLLSIGLTPFVFYKLIKPTFGIVFDEEDLEREKKFRDFVEKRRTKL